MFCKPTFKNKRAEWYRRRMMKWTYRTPEKWCNDYVVCDYINGVKRWAKGFPTASARNTQLLQRVYNEGFWVARKLMFAGMGTVRFETYDKVIDVI